MNQTELLRVATQAAVAGGDVLMRHLHAGVVVRDKSSSGGETYDLVSDADLESERTIATSLLDNYPDHQLLGEEELGKGVDVTTCEHLWIIDPLDGTNNYVHGLPHFAVSIAYHHLGKPVVGVVYNPARNDLFTASASTGSRYNDRPVGVCDAKTLSKTLIGCGFYYDRGEMMRRTLRTIEEFFSHDIHGIRRFGTAALDLCMVGCGHFGGYFEYKLSPWDFAAGRLFVELAGGKVTTADGSPLQLMSSSLLASNGTLHEVMLRVTRKHHPAT